MVEQNKLRKIKDFILSLTPMGLARNKVAELETELNETFDRLCEATNDDVRYCDGHTTRLVIDQRDYDDDCGLLRAPIASFEATEIFDTESVEYDTVGIERRVEVATNTRTNRFATKWSERERRDGVSYSSPDSLQIVRLENGKTTGWLRGVWETKPIELVALLRIIKNSKFILNTMHEIAKDLDIDLGQKPLAQDDISC
ncbi:MAG: hypothetical protein FWC00_02085 [Firmicutes bacterium]|nr:hypothetical protein [Bacillota bacterium]